MTEAPKKAQPRTPPPGRRVWYVLLGLAAALEVTAILVKQFGWTLSHAVWWLQGDVGTDRWRLVGWPIFALMLWASWHFVVGADNADRWANGWHLLAAVLVALAAAAAPILIRAGG